MSHFFGTLYGTPPLDGSGRPSFEPSMVSVGATAEMGLEAILRSAEGSLSVRLEEGQAADGGMEDRVLIRFIPNEPEREFTLYAGPLSVCDFNSIFANTQEVER